jgi:hypothetical protein
MIIGYTTLTYTQFSGSVDYVGGTNISIVGQTISVSGTIAATLGGTGTSTVAVGDLLYGSGTNTWGKLAAGAGYKSLVMNAGGTNVEWNAVSLNQTGAVSGALPTGNGGTGLTTYTLGDLIYSSATNTLAKLAGNTTASKTFLVQTGAGGGVSAAPSWGTISAADVSGLAPSATTDTTDATNITSGTLPVARLNGSYTGITGVGTLAAGTWNGGTIAAAYGGTGQSSYAVGDLLYADTTTSLAKLADIVSGNALLSGGVGTAPAWGKIGLTTHISGTLAIANGGTGATDAATARSNLGAGTGNGSVTSVAAGSYLTGGTITTTGTLAVDATTTNTAGKVVARDGSGNFSAGTITANLTGNVTGNVTGNTSGSAATFTSTSQNSQFNSVGVGTAGSGTAGEIRATNNITAYYSDDRLKTRLGKIENALDKLCTLDGFYYEANETAQALGYDVKREVGISAQQMQAVIPEIVVPAPIDEKYFTVRYERALPLLIEAIKELRQEVQDIKKAIEK